VMKQQVSQSSRNGQAGSGRALEASSDPRPAARVLIDSVQQVPDQSYPWDRIDPDNLLRAALLHGVAPAVALHLRGRPDVPKELSQRLQGCYRDQLARHLRTLSDLRPASEALRRAGLTWAVVKGPALAERLWPRPDMRLYVDLDLVVDRRRFGDCLETLEGLGATYVDRNWPLIRDRVRGEVSMQLPHGTPLDLHWHVVNEADLRSQFTFKMEEMFSRTVDSELGGTVSPTFDDVDTLLHLTYHMVLSGGHKLVWLKDFDLAASVPDLDWHEVRSRARSYGCELALDVVLRRTARVLHPQRAFVHSARRSGWAEVASVADRLRPPPNLPGERRSGRIVFQSTRASGVRSVRAAARAVFQSRDGGPPGANPLHELHDDAEARRAYLGLVQGAVAP
jgi:Uncharacterised nucleotidyltransferase